MRQIDRCWLTLLGLGLLGLAPIESAKTTLRVLTYNAWHGTYRSARQEILRFPGESQTARNQRHALQTRLLQELGADLILLQEVAPMPHRVRVLADELGYDATHLVTDCGLKFLGIGPPLNLNSGLAVLARPELRMRRLGHSRLSGPPSPCWDHFGLQIAEARYALAVEITLPADRRLGVINTHLHHRPVLQPSFGQALADEMCAGLVSSDQGWRTVRHLSRRRERQLAETEALLEFRRALEEAAPAPFFGWLVGGDLNAPANDAILERLSADGLNDAGYGVRGQPGPTYDPRDNALAALVRERASPGIPTFGNESLRRLLRRHRDLEARRIDHVLVSSRLLPAVRQERLFAKDPVASDHYGVEIVLDLDRD